MITFNFLKNCSELEAGLLHLILIESFYECGYEPSFSCITSLRKDMVLKKLENCKSKIIPENLHVIESLQKKLSEEL